MSAHAINALSSLIAASLLRRHCHSLPPPSLFLAFFSYRQLPSLHVSWGISFMFSVVAPRLFMYIEGRGKRWFVYKERKEGRRPVSA
ncbi:unnamed protein product [Linum trigynum]|uniref:Secreted protein n=1 Tax=Linum trigynum TaxID=586398 RepID=A0AAV2CAM1_9ROSI